MKLRLTISSIFCFRETRKWYETETDSPSFSCFAKLKGGAKFCFALFRKTKILEISKTKKFFAKNNFAHLSFAHKTYYVTFCKKCLSFHSAIFIYFSFRMWKGIFREIWNSRNKLYFFLSTTKLVFHENLENCKMNKIWVTTLRENL